MIFTKSAAVYDALYSFKNYQQESERIGAIIEARKQSAGNDLLDVACGTGHHISFLKKQFRCQGVDLSQGLLEIARERNPDAEFHHGDMTGFDLGRQFDVVTCLFSAIGYLLDVNSLNQALWTMSQHLKSGGVLVLEPWYTPGRYIPGTLHGIYVDRPDMKVSRMNVSQIVDGYSRLHFHYMVGTALGIETFIEDHILSLFTNENYEYALKQAGLSFEHDEVGLSDRGLYIGTKQ